MDTAYIFFLTKTLIIFYATTVQRARHFGANFGIYIFIFCAHLFGDCFLTWNCVGLNIDITVPVQARAALM